MEEETHRKELAELKTKLVDAEANLSEQTKRKEDLEKQEQQYWKEYSKHKREVTLLMIDLLKSYYLDCLNTFSSTRSNQLVYFSASNGRR